MKVPKKQTLEYYEWSDIEQFLCEQMGIPVDGFRNFYLHYGPCKGMSFSEYWDGETAREEEEHMDFWNFWTEEINDVTNDSYLVLYLDDYLFKKLNKCKKWQKQIIKPLKELKKALGEEIVIHYWW